MSSLRSHTRAARLMRCASHVIWALVASTAIASTPVQSDAARTAIETLEDLVVKGKAPRTGYARGEFGPNWSDVDRNGCDTRNDILRRDLRQTIAEPRTMGCVVLSGVLNDPYSGTQVTFVRGQATSNLVHIDHVVALGNAWQTGAFQWTSDKRKTFANDPLNLFAVSGALNSQKRDGDAATWLPPDRSFRCRYVARQIAVKQVYGLWVTPPEKEAMRRTLSSCPRQPLL